MKRARGKRVWPCAQTLQQQLKHVQPGALSHNNKPSSYDAPEAAVGSAQAITSNSMHDRLAVSHHSSLLAHASMVTPSATVLTDSAAVVPATHAAPRHK